MWRRKSFKIANKKDPVKPAALKYYLESINMSEEEFLRCRRELFSDRKYDAFLEAAAQPPEAGGEMGGEFGGEEFGEEEE